jgi:hypothetical protein
MLIVMSMESVFVTRAGEDLTVLATKDAATPHVRPAMVPKNGIVSIVWIMQLKMLQLDTATVMIPMAVSTVLIGWEPVP